MSEKRSELYKMRDAINTLGLQDLINYINEFRATSDMKMIEIGSYAGESTTMFAKSFKEVIAIDPYLNDYDLSDITCQYMYLTDVYNTFLNNISNYKNISHIKKTSDEAVNEIPNDFVDFVYIDGLHTYEQVKKDIANYLPKIKNGGFIGGHDYHPNHQGVVDAINENFKIDFLFHDTSWIVKINK
jgi:hypothetical protein